MSTQRGVYVHIPFCVVRCSYCDFNAYAGVDDKIPGYVEALLAEIRARADGGRVDTIFFGGGTPTQIPAELLTSVLDELRTRFRVDANAEITVEANPETADGQKLRILRAAGFNRVSIGVQSLATHTLQRLGRVHSAGSALSAIEAAAAAGFAHINADLIFGTPGESVEEWRHGLERVIATGVDHVSAYALMIEEGTPLAARVGRGESPAPDDDDQADKYEIAHRVLTDNGFERYEISNWAKADGRCRHNEGYWNGSDYFGFGAGAHSHLSGRRSWNVKSLQAYVSVSDVEDGFEELTRAQRMQDAAILGLRTSDGLGRRDFARTWGRDPLELLDPASTALSLLDVRTDRLKLIEDAFFLHSAVARELIASG